jgi:hypothetical protein
MNDRLRRILIVANLFALKCPLSLRERVGVRGRLMRKSLQRFMIMLPVPAPIPLRF